MNALEAYKATKLVNPNCFTGGRFMKSCLLSNIINAEKFVFTDVDVFSNMSASFHKTPLFSERMAIAGDLPFERCWFEYNYESNSILAGGGLLVCRHEKDDCDRVISMMPFIKMDGRIAPLMLGLIIDLKDGLHHYDAVGYSGAIAMHDDYVAKFMTFASTLLNFTMLLLECKNIVTEDVPTPPKRKMKRGSIKTFLPEFSYKTLKVIVGGKRRASSGCGISSGNHQNRQHLCRGHFKTFTEDKPLMGRAVGRFWWNSSVRGNPALGVVDKEYVINCLNAG